MAATPVDVTGFWISAGPRQWFSKSAAFDDAIRLKFEPVHHAAARGEYAPWAGSRRRPNRPSSTRAGPPGEVGFPMKPRRAI
ncbi:MAG: DUF924 family protein [Caulobacteraceae bacterium]|nr:DUF924 family protein [Caulobacteraceae bacterium]